MDNLFAVLQHDKNCRIVQEGFDLNQPYKLPREIKLLEDFDYKKWKLNNFSNNLHDFTTSKQANYVIYE